MKLWVGVGGIGVTVGETGIGVMVGGGGTGVGGRGVGGGWTTVIAVSVGVGKNGGGIVGGTIVVPKGGTPGIVGTTGTVGLGGSVTTGNGPGTKALGEAMGENAVAEAVGVAVKVGVAEGSPKFGIPGPAELVPDGTEVSEPGDASGVIATTRLGVAAFVKADCFLAGPTGMHPTSINPSATATQRSGREKFIKLPYCRVRLLGTGYRPTTDRNSNP